MEDKFLIGNDIIEKALAEANVNMDDDTVMNLVYAIQQRMVADGHVLLPVEFPDPEDPHTFNMRGLPNEEGEIYLACFTSQEELDKGEPTAVVSQFIDVFIDAVLESDSVKGIMINPFGITCRLPKGILQIVMEARQPSDDDYKRENYLLEKAIHFATNKHAGQLRKGTTTPYIVHPLETMNILRSMNADTNLLIAGLLHDTVEDTDTTVEEIAEVFGTDVAALVGGHSEDKSKTWEERKTHAIQELAESSTRMKMLVMADKVSNLRSIASDYKALGDDLWTRFNAPKEKQAWYYSGIQDSLWDMQTNENTSHVYWEMVGLFKDVFVTYYEVHELCPPGYYDDYILQVCMDGTAYRFDKGSPTWKETWFHENQIDDDCTLVTRVYAERLEDEWYKQFWDLVDQDLKDAKYVLINKKGRFAEIVIESGCLALNGEDHGSACQKINGKDEYEYHVTLDAENTKEIVALLRMKYSLELSLNDILSREFGSEMPSSKLMAYCAEKEIKYSFVSF